MEQNMETATEDMTALPGKYVYNSLLAILQGEQCERLLYTAVECKKRKQRTKAIRLGVLANSESSRQTVLFVNKNLGERVFMFRS